MNVAKYLTIEIEKIVPHSLFSREGDTPCCGAQGNTGIGHKAEGERETADRSLYCGYCGKQQARSGNQD